MVFKKTYALIVVGIMHGIGTYPLGPSTLSLINEASKRSIPHIVLNGGSFIQLGYGKNQRRIRTTRTDKTTAIGDAIADDKALTKKLLADAEIPVPAGVLLTTPDDIPKAINTIGFPLTIKPLDSNHGRGIAVGITNPDDVLSAFNSAKRYSDKVIIEETVVGQSFRVLVINHVIVAATLCQAPVVIGNGTATIKELIEIENRNPLRSGYGNVLSSIAITDDTIKMLKKQQYTLETIVPDGVTCELTSQANLYAGGASVDVTDSVHPENKKLFERVSRILDLDICGIDIVAPSVSEPITQNGGAVIEVNTAPDFAMHLHPFKGKPRNVAKPVIDMLFPPGTSWRIPIIAVAHSEQSLSIATRLADALQKKNVVVGSATTAGITIGNETVTRNNAANYNGAQLVLKDPLVEVAILELSPSTITETGLGFDYCDIAVISNCKSPDDKEFMKALTKNIPSQELLILDTNLKRLNPVVKKIMRHITPTLRRKS